MIDRGDFVTIEPDDGHTAAAPGGAPSPIETDPAIVAELIERDRASVAALKRDISTKTGSDLFDFILDDIQVMRRLLFDPRSHQVYITAMDATAWSPLTPTRVGHPCS